MELISVKRFGAALSAVFVFVFGVLAILGAPGDVDPAFIASAYGQLNGPVYAVKKQPDGKYLVGGNFYDLNGVAATGLARLNADLTVDATFNPPDFGNGFGVGAGFGLGGTVYAIGVQSDGRIIVGGEIFRTDGVFRPSLKRLMPNGALDESFQAPEVPIFRIYYDIEVLPGDKFLVDGKRFNADGTIDGSFTEMSAAREIELSPDGKILAVTGGDNNGSLRRFKPDGTVDSAFAPVATDGQISAIVGLPTGKWLIAGNFSFVNGFEKGKIARINADGTLDSTFNQGQPGFDGRVTEMRLTPAGKLAISGAFGSYNATPANRLIVLNADGTRDASFQSAVPATASAANGFEFTPDGKWLVGFSANAALNSLALVNPDGTLDNSLNAVASRGGSVTDIAQQPDGRLIVAGSFLYSNGAIRRSLARLNRNGSLDPSFVPYFAAVHLVNKVVLQPDGKILVGANQGPGLVRLNPDGSQDAGFSTTFPPTANVYDIAVLPDGKILATGDIGGGRVVRLNSDGSTDAAFTTLQFNDVGRTLAVQPDGRILVGGLFTTVGSNSRGRIARLNADGTFDNSFNPPFGGSNGEIYEIALQPDGKVVLGGIFTTLNGNGSISGVGKLNPDGTLDAGFIQNKPISGILSAIEVQPDGKVVAGGSFTGIGSEARNGIVRFNADGSIDQNFNSSVNMPGSTGVLEIFRQADGKLLIGGVFTKAKGLSRVRVARLMSDFSPIAPLRSPFDYEGDGKADISVFRPSENKWYILRSSDFAIVQTVFAAPGDLAAPADYDGDGKTDLAVFRPETGDWHYQSSVTGAPVSVHWGANGDLPRPSDFDGDGKADFVVFRPSTGLWYRLSAAGASSNIAFGTSGDNPLIGDFDGDGKSDLAIFRPSTGDWWYRGSANGQFVVVHWGQMGDIPVPGDYDGDGKTDFVVFRPSDGGWYILYTTGSYTIATFGQAGDKPVAADYDGDGRADLAVWRPADRTWYLLQTTAGFGALPWGAATDVPTENAFLP